jgi:putative membrane protein
MPTPNPVLNDRDRTDSTTRLAAERTLLAWIRTSLAMMGFGFVVARFGLFLRELVAHDRDLPIRSYGLSLWIGTTLVMLGVVTSLIAAGQHFRVLRHLRRGEPIASPRWPLSIGVAIVLSLIGVLMAGYLVMVDR